jgi:hypothetical protein
MREYKPIEVIDNLEMQIRQESQFENQPRMPNNKDAYKL